MDQRISGPRCAVLPETTGEQLQQSYPLLAEQCAILHIDYLPIVDPLCSMAEIVRSIDVTYTTTDMVHVPFCPAQAVRTHMK